MIRVQEAARAAALPPHKRRDALIDAACRRFRRVAGDSMMAIGDEATMRDAMRAAFLDVREEQMAEELRTEHRNPRQPLRDEMRISP